MNYKFYNTLAFVAGAAIGSLVTWKILKDRYENIEYDDQFVPVEDDSEKEPTIEECVEKIIEQTDKKVVKSLNDKPDLFEYAKKIQDLGYSNEAVEEVEERREKVVPPQNGDVYIITPDEYDNSVYEAETLVYYADGVLTDAYDDIIDDIEDYVVPDFADHFGEFEDDTVYVRNEAHECDYEIQKDLRNYHEDINPQESTEE